MHLLTSHPRVSVAGIPVRTNPGWLVLAAIVSAITVESLAPSGNAAELFRWSLRVLAVAAGAVGSLILHELGHALVARRQHSRLLSLDPALFGALSDDAYHPQDPPSEARVALAGPIVSGFIAGVALLAAWASATFGVDDLARVFVVLAIVNATIAGVNLTPAFPFDGGRVLRAFIWYLSDDLVTGTRIAAAYGQVLITFGFVAGVVLVSAGERASLVGAWGLLVFWMVNRASRDGVSRTIWREAGDRLTVGDVGLGSGPQVTVGQTIDAAIDDVLHAAHHGPVLVTDGGEVVGVFSLRLVRRVPRAIWTERHVRDVVQTLDGLSRVDLSSPVTELFEHFDAPDEQVVLITAKEHVVGAVDRAHAIRQLREHLAAERALRLRQPRK